MNGYGARTPARPAHLTGAAEGRRTRLVLAVEVLVIVIGLGMFGWGWSRPVGLDPYATLVDPMPTRWDDPTAVRLVVGGLALAAVGLLAVLVTVVVVAVRARRAR